MLGKRHHFPSEGATEHSLYPSIPKYRHEAMLASRTVEELTALFE
jgi:hypothetical protein